MEESSWEANSESVRKFPTFYGTRIFITVFIRARNLVNTFSILLQEMLSLGVKRPEREADYSPPSSTEVTEWVELYFHSPIRLHGVVLS
jgi:hypothetical protein